MIDWKFILIFGVLLGLPIAIAGFALKAGHAEFKRLAERLHHSRIGRLSYGFYTAFTFVFGTYLLVGKGGSLIAHVAGNFPMACMFVASGFFSAARMRVGTERTCAACGYQYAPEMEKEAGAELCPECGASWRAPGGLMVGRMSVSRPTLVAAILLALVPFAHVAFSFANLGARGRLLRYLPTDSLIAEVTAPAKGFTMSEWAELSTRTLNPVQERTLARGLLDLRLVDSVNRDAQGWLEKHALSGRMGQDLRARYFRETIELRLEQGAPEPTDPAGKVRVRLAGTWRGNYSFPTNTSTRDRVFFGGFLVGDGASPVERPVAEISGIEFAPTSKGSPPSVLVEPGQRVRASAWVVVGPWNVRENPVVWAEGGEPVIPAWAIWSERVELEWPAP